MASDFDRRRQAVRSGADDDRVQRGARGHRVRSAIDGELLYPVESARDEEERVQIALRHRHAHPLPVDSPSNVSLDGEGRAYVSTGFHVLSVAFRSVSVRFTESIVPPKRSNF